MSAGKKRAATQGRITSVRYDRATSLVLLRVRGGSRLTFDPAEVANLNQATADELAAVRVVDGVLLWWWRLNVAMGFGQAVSLALGVTTASEAGRRGGSRVSEVKAAAARENGSIQEPSRRGREGS